MLMLVAIAVAFAGIALAWLIYGRQPLKASARPAGPLKALVSHGYYFDAFYEGVIVRALGWLSSHGAGPRRRAHVGPGQHGPARPRRA
jgi:NADH:ubiquinone oxidoreductase subunit 5 (subunit L)/multisubunit Na+/H+ antiporter MnhA subunit